MFISISFFVLFFLHVNICMRVCYSFDVLFVTFNSKHLQIKNFFVLLKRIQIPVSSNTVGPLFFLFIQYLFHFSISKCFFFPYLSFFICRSKHLLFPFFFHFFLINKNYLLFCVQPNESSWSGLFRKFFLT